MDLSALPRMAPAPTSARYHAGPPDAHGHAHAHATPPTAGDAVGGTDGQIRTETLDNGVRLVIAERPGAASTKIQVGIGSGALHDPPGKEGLAHLLEHMAFEGSPTRTATEQERIRHELGGNWNAYTTDASVVYYGVVPGAQAKQGAALLTDMFRNPKTSGPYLKQERAAVSNEMVNWGGSVRDEQNDVLNRLVHGDHPSVTNLIGTKKTVGAITPADLKQWHAKHYVGANTVALVEGDPKRLPLDTIRRELGALPKGERPEPPESPPVKPGQAMQVINDPSVDTVQLDFVLPTSLMNVALAKTPPALVQTALSERLNTRLRREQDLTYGVRAGLSILNDSTAALRVTTMVPAKHAQQAATSIIETLKDARDGFGPKTFETHKAGALAAVRTMEAPAPLSVSERAELAFQDALMGAELVVPPATEKSSKGSQRHQLGRTDAKVFARDMAGLVNFDDMKVLVAGKVSDGGEAVRKGLRDAGIPTRGFEMNPVDMGRYEDMGLRVNEDTVPPLKR